MSSRDRRAQAAIDEAATPEGPGRLPAELRAELRRLLAAMLVADVRSYPTIPEEVGEGAADSLVVQNSRK